MMEYRNVFKKIKQILFIPKIKVKRDVTPLSQDHLPSYLKEGRDLEGIFTTIFRSNVWADNESVSGPGSNLVQTQIILTEIPKLIRSLGVTTMLDVPCGDFRWMSEVELDGVKYIGADIVADLVERNQNKFGNENRKFIHLDLTKKVLPQVDLILCRDCLVHLSFENIQKALENIQNSGSKYLLLTTFSDRESNYDILSGQWRPINFMKPPFSFKSPQLLINENCTEENGIYKDKCLGLWKIEDLRYELNKK